MKKILYIVSTLRRTGPTSQLLNLIKNLDRSVFEPVVITLSPEPDDSRWEDYDRLNIEMHSLNLSRMAGLFRARTQLSSLVNRLMPDLIHTQGIRADVLSAKLEFYAPRIATVRNFPQIDFPMTYGRFVGRWMASWQAGALSKLHKVVGVSNAVKLNLEEAFSLTNTAVVQNGVETLNYFPASKQEKQKYREKLGLPTDKKLWLVSGHLIDRKDPIFLINLWQKVVGGYEDNALIFIGGGSLQSRCEDLAQKIEEVRVVGRVDNVHEYLMASDYYLSSAVAEGLPNAALEAMACGLPVLLSDIGPHKEIFDMSPNIGELFKLGNECDFMNSFKMLLESDYEMKSNAALSIIQDKLSAEDMSKKYQALYQELVGA